MCFQHLESVIKSRIPGITSLINRSIDELESELDHLGRPVAIDAGVGTVLLVHYSCCWIISEVKILTYTIIIFLPGPVIYHLRVMPCI